MESNSLTKLLNLVETLRERVKDLTTQQNAILEKTEAIEREIFVQTQCLDILKKVELKLRSQ